MQQRSGGGWCVLLVTAGITACASVQPVADARLGQVGRLGLVSFSAPANVPLPVGMGRDQPRRDQPFFDALATAENDIKADDGIGQEVLERLHPQVVSTLSSQLGLAVEPGDQVAQKPGYLELTPSRVVEAQGSPQRMVPLDTHPAALERLGPFAKTSGLDGAVVIRIPDLKLSTNGPSQLEASCRVQLWVIGADGSALYRNMGQQRSAVFALSPNQAVRAQVVDAFSRLIMEGVAEHAANMAAARAGRGAGG